MKGLYEQIGGIVSCISNQSDLYFTDMFLGRQINSYNQFLEFELRLTSEDALDGSGDDSYLDVRPSRQDVVLEGEGVEPDGKTSWKIKAFLSITAQVWR